MAKVGNALVATEVSDELGINDLYDQVLTNIELENARTHRVGSSARRIVVAIFDIIKARRRSGLPPYRETVIRAVIWLTVRSH